MGPGWIEQQIPEPFNHAELMKNKAGDPSALHTVLFQEVERYNMLLTQIRDQCATLQKGIQGLLVMSADMTIMFECFAAGKVPPQWIK
jgi:dynein heavy chain